MTTNLKLSLLASPVAVLVALLCTTCNRRPDSIEPATTQTLLAPESAVLGTGAIAVRSLPAPAVVWLDGRLMGVTAIDEPLTVLASPGPHILRVTLAGYQDLEGTVDVRNGMTLPATACLTPNWDFSRQGAAEIVVAPGQIHRGELPPGRGDATRRVLRVDAPKGVPLRLEWVGGRFPPKLSVVLGDKAVYVSSPKDRRGVVRFSVPEALSALIVVESPATMDDSVTLGLIRYSVSLSVDACLPDERGRLRAPKINLK